MRTDLSEWSGGVDPVWRLLEPSTANRTLRLAANLPDEALGESASGRNAPIVIERVDRDGAEESAAGSTAQATRKWTGFSVSRSRCRKEAGSMELVTVFRAYLEPGVTRSSVGRQFEGHG